MNYCAFCDRVLRGVSRTPARYYHDNTVAAFADAYPSAPGHTLVIPVRHVRRVEELARPEWAALFDVAYTELDRLRTARDPDGFTIGINDGPIAGRTVPHVHLHLIPREAGDTAEPRGGIRWAIPETAAYWEQQS